MMLWSAVVLWVVLVEGPPRSEGMKGGREGEKSDEEEEQSR